MIKSECLKSKTPWLIFSLLALFLTIADADPLLAQRSPDKGENTQGKAQEICRKVQNRYEEIKSFSAELTQVLKSSASGDVETRQGKIFFAKPLLIRWETKKPEEELFIVNSAEAWNYIPSEKAAYKYPVSEVMDSKTMLKFLSGQARLTEEFKVKFEALEKGESTAALRLEPREPEPSLVMARAWVDPKSGLLRRIIIQDFFGNENDLTLEDIKINVKMENEIFKFAPPKGVSIIDNTLKDNEPDSRDLR